MRQLRLFLLLLLIATAAGCRSHVVRVELTNTSTQPLFTIVVDYPGATFGVDKLDPSKTYSYPIKPLETGSLKIQFVDASGKTHNFTGPVLEKNDEGSLAIQMGQDGAQAETKSLQHSR